MIDSARILAFCKTKDEANIFQEHIEQLLQSLFSNTPFEEMVNEVLSHEKKEKLLAFLKEQHVDTANAQQIQACLQEIKKTISESSIVTLTLAFAPKQQVVETISTWFTVYTKKFVLLDILVDTNLIGGTIISYNGTYKDYSLKNIFEEKYKQGEIQFEEHL
jgi:F0F1-type ATP synthase delta subunit